MTKRDLVKWLESEKQRALIVARDKRNQMQEDAAEEIYKAIDLDKFISEMEAGYKELIKHFDDLAERCKSVDGVSVSKFHWKLSCAEYLRYVEDVSYLKEQARDVVKISQCESYKTARNKSIAYYNNVERTYDDVIQTVKNLPSAKDGLEYLTKLGFDVSAILPVQEKKQLPATISVNVDTRYLILNKDKK